MTHEQVAQIIIKEVKKAGYMVETHQSVSTSSIYYKLSNGRCTLMFRVSDHNTKKNVITLRLDTHNSQQSVESFVKARIKDLGYRILKHTLGI